MKQLHPRAVWLFFLRFVITAIVLSIVFGNMFFVLFLATQTNEQNIVPPETVRPVFATAFVWSGVLFIASLTLAFLWAKLTYHCYRYELREDGFRKESGVIWKHYVTIPYERIQNVDIYRGLLDRILRLSDLHIQTAGFSGYGGRLGGSSEGRLPGLNPQVAEQLRDELVRRARGSSKNQGL